jgi:hypothetical protein
MRLLRRLILTTIKLTSALVILATLSLTLYIQNQAESFDPISAIHQLKGEHRRDEALELTRFFRENQPDNPNYVRLETELDYTLAEKLKTSLWNGMIKGEVFDTPSGIGAMAADLTLFGDIRDLIIQGWNLITGSQDLEKSTAILSGAGVALTFVPLLDGTSALAKNAIKYVHRFPVFVEKGLIREFVKGSLSLDETKRIWNLFKKTTCPFQSQSLS